MPENNLKGCLSDYIPVFSNSIPSELHVVFEVLWAQDKEVYIVGGAIRDCLFGLPITDLDIITNAHPKEVKKLFNAKGIKIKSIGGHFGTILVILTKDITCEVSTFRKEIYSSIGPPEVIFVNSLEEDLPRRDFSFNAIVYNPKNQKFIDKYDGFKDLKEGRIQTIGHAHTRFSEDGTRIIRLARFVSQFDLEIHPNLLATLYEIGNNARFFSYTTLQKEFFKLLSLHDPTRGLSLLWDTKVLNAIFPNFPLKSYVREVRTEKILSNFLRIPSRDIWIKLFGLLLFLSEKLDQTEEIWHSVALDFKITSKERKKLVHIFQSWVKFPIFPETKELKRWIRATGINTSEDLVQVIFLEAKLEERVDILVKQDRYLKEVQNILDSFRGGSSSTIS